MHLKYDFKDWKIESVYDPTRHMVNFVGNIGHACCTI